MRIIDRSQENLRAQANASPIRLMIISDIRFFCESLAENLPRQGMLSISGIPIDLPSAIRDLGNNQPDIILLDEGFPDGYSAVARIRNVAPQSPVIVLAVSETVDDVIPWAEAGASGYIPKTASLAEIPLFLSDLLRGKQACSKSVAAALFRRLAGGKKTNGGGQGTASAPALTAREAQVAEMIVAGMSNKDIARCLNIGVATAKTHVHHLLRKLSLQRRGQAASWMRKHRDHQ